MRLVVVGGQARKVGKTSVIAGLIRGLSGLAWTAVKISHHEGDAGFEDALSAGRLPGNTAAFHAGLGLAEAQAAPRANPAHDSTPGHLPPHLNFMLSEETDATGDGDTSLYLAAGARRALWLRTRGVGLSHGLPCLVEALEGGEHVIIESTSVVGFLKPSVFLMVTDESRSEVKASARRSLDRADALVIVKAEREPGDPPEGSLEPAAGRQVFTVSRGGWWNPALCRFVGERLGVVG